MIECGKAYPIRHDAGVDEHEKIIELAVADARNDLSPGTIFEIRSKPYPPKIGESIPMPDYGRRKDVTREDLVANWGIAWHVGHPITDSTFRLKADAGIPYPGYALIARVSA